MLRLGLAAEAPADVRVVAALGDRVIQEGRDWITEEVIDHYRTWAGLGTDPFLDLHRAFIEARSRRLRVHGHFSDQPGEHDARMVRAALLLFATESPLPQVAVIARDVDGKSERVRGFEQARDAGTWPFAVVLAAPAPEREAWLLIGFEARDDREREALGGLRRELGFDPTHEPERLKHGREDAKRNAKRVLEVLTDVRDAEERLAVANLEHLRDRGLGCGLARFLQELAEAVLPHLGAPT